MLSSFALYQDLGEGMTRTSLSERDGGDDILEAMEVLVPDVMWSMWRQAVVRF